MAAGKLKPSQPGCSKEDCRSQVGAQAQNNCTTRQGRRTSMKGKFGHKEREQKLSSESGKGIAKPTKGWFVINNQTKPLRTGLVPKSKTGQNPHVGVKGLQLWKSSSVGQRARWNWIVLFSQMEKNGQAFLMRENQFQVPTRGTDARKDPLGPVLSLSTFSLDYIRKSVYWTEWLWTLLSYLLPGY